MNPGGSLRLPHLEYGRLRAASRLFDELAALGLDPGPRRPDRSLDAGEGSNGRSRSSTAHSALYSQSDWYKRPGRSAWGRANAIGRFLVVRKCGRLVAKPETKSGSAYICMDGTSTGGALDELWSRLPVGLPNFISHLFQRGHGDGSDHIGSSTKLRLRVLKKTGPKGGSIP